MSTTSFPFDVSYSGADMAALFGVPIETFKSGDEFDFTSTITLNDGRVYNSLVTGCVECPDTLVDEEGNPLDPGTWNGGTIDSVIMQSGDTNENGLLPAVYYRVKYLDPSD